MIDRFAIELRANDWPGWTPGGYVLSVHYRADGTWRHGEMPMTSIEPEHWQSQMEFLFTSSLHALIDAEKAAADASPNTEALHPTT